MSDIIIDPNKQLNLQQNEQTIREETENLEITPQKPYFPMIQ
jgi:hypothetical protein